MRKSKEKRWSVWVTYRSNTSGYIETAEAVKRLTKQEARTVAREMFHVETVVAAWIRYEGRVL